MDLPKAIWMASISAITAGSSPTIQSTAAIQASQEKSRSTMRATAEFGNIHREHARQQPDTRQRDQDRQRRP